MEVIYERCRSSSDRDLHDRMSSGFLWEVQKLRNYKWLVAGAEQFSEMLDDSSSLVRERMKIAFADALDFVLEYPRMGSPLTIKGVRLNKKTSGKFVLISRYDEDLDEVELIGFYYQASSYTNLLEQIL